MGVGGNDRGDVITNVKSISHSRKAGGEPIRINAFPKATSEILSCILCCITNRKLKYLSHFKVFTTPTSLQFPHSRSCDSCRTDIQVLEVKTSSTITPMKHMKHMCRDDSFWS